jgi:hypothetical protein
MGLATDALLSMLAPLWQTAIAAVVVLVVLVASARLAVRGRSRMRTALLIIGGALVMVTALIALTYRT